MRNTLWLLTVPFVLGIGLVGPIACEQSANTTPANRMKGGTESAAAAVPGLGRKPPDFSLQDLQGRPVELGRFHGKAIFINFWATWCVPCRAEMPAMEKLYQDFKDRDFVMLAISGDLGGKEDVKPFLEEFKFTFPILLDPDLKIHDLYGVRGIPTTFLIDKKGTVAQKMLGARDWNQKEARDLINKLVGAR